MIKGEIDTEADITEHADGKGWEVYQEEKRDSNWDTDQDGMPDWYERLIGSDAHAANQNDDPDGDGWTVLEDYLELMAHPYLVIVPNGEATLDLKPYFAGFYGQNGEVVTPTYTIGAGGSHLFTATVAGSVLHIAAASQGGVAYVPVTVNDGETTFKQRFGVAVTGDPTAMKAPVTDIDQIEAVRREFFTPDGRQVSALQAHGVYVMKVTDKQGTVHTAKIIAR